VPSPKGYAALKLKIAPSVILRQDLKAQLGLARCPIVRSAADVARVFSNIAVLEREVMFVGAVDTKCRLLCWELLAVGTTDRLALRIGDAFTSVVHAGGSGIFLAHNHPSGSLKTSAEDYELTLKVAKAGLLLGYPLFDHVIITKNGYRSLMMKASLRPRKLVNNLAAEDGNLPVRV
jgi:DNA repair protein RadC